MRCAFAVVEALMDVSYHDMQTWGLKNDICQGVFEKQLTFSYAVYSQSLRIELGLVKIWWIVHRRPPS